MEKENTDPPKEIEDKPALLLAWRGLEIAISEGVMTRKDAYAMLERWDKEGVTDAVQNREIGEQLPSDND